MLGGTAEAVIPLTRSHITLPKSSRATMMSITFQISRSKVILAIGWKSSMINAATTHLIVSPRW